MLAQPIVHVVAAAQSCDLDARKLHFDSGRVFITVYLHHRRRGYSS
jgi:hypothetical protein